jgi:GntR family transcriptional regulator, trigonelline degradation regulator
VAALRDAIARGHYQAGERLVERELCERLAISRASLREALRELETDGVVVSLVNRGVFVSTISVRSAREVYQIRAMLESILAERCALYASKAQILALEESVEQLAQAYATGRGVVQAKNGFYESLASGADHDLAASMLRGIQLRASQLRLLTLADPDRVRHSLSEIRAVVRAIKKRDSAGAMAAARTHVENAGALALRLLERNDQLAGAVTSLRATR